jgi:hypothetical protein
MVRLPSSQGLFSHNAASLVGHVHRPSLLPRRVRGANASAFPSVRGDLFAGSSRHHIAFQGKVRCATPPGAKIDSSAIAELK